MVICDSNAITHISFLTRRISSREDKRQWGTYVSYVEGNGWVCYTIWICRWFITHMPVCVMYLGKCQVVFGTRQIHQVENETQYHQCAGNCEMQSIGVCDELSSMMMMMVDIDDDNNNSNNNNNNNNNNNDNDKTITITMTITMIIIITIQPRYVDICKQDYFVP